MLVIFGLAKLGNVIRFIPESVILGFTAGIAVVIWVGQWQNFFGLEPVAAEAFNERLLELITALPHLHPATTLLGIASVLMIVLWPRLPVLGAVPSPLVALIASTAFVSLTHPEGVATVSLRSPTPPRASRGPRRRSRPCCAARGGA